MNITTPSGYKVEFKDSFTYGDQRALSRLLMNDIKVDPRKGEDQDLQIPAVVAMDREEKGCEILLKRITKPDETELTKNLLNEVFAMPPEDGEAVFAQVRKLLNPNPEIPETGKKN